MSNPPDPRPHDPEQPQVTYSPGSPETFAVGAPFYPKPSGRPMKYFPITEAELIAASILNTVCTTFIGLASAMLTLTLGFTWDLWIDDTASATDAAILPWVFLILTIACAGIAARAWYKRHSQFDKIIESCQEIELPVTPEGHDTTKP